MAKSTSRQRPKVDTPPAELSDAAANQVRLVGRVAGAATMRELPSGDTVTVFRLVVDRPAKSRRPRGPTSDTVDCAAWSARLRQRAAGLPAGTLVEVDGALRRRFWRTPAGPASRYEVEVSGLRRVTSTAALGAADDP